MLQALRNQISSWVIKILLGLLIVSFAVWGINDIFLGERDPVVAEIGDVKLTRSQVNDEIREEINRLQPLFGGRLNREEADRMGITGQVLENLVNRAAVAQGARDLGITISDQLVARRITSDETFFNSRGQFDRSIFIQVLSRAGMTEDYYVANLKRDLAAAEIRRAVAAAVPVPDAVVEPLVRFRSERRLAKWIKVPVGAGTKVPEPSPAEIEAFYQAHQQRFVAPELREVSWVELDPAEMAKEINISEERLRQAYEERKDEFSSRDRREVEQVVFRTEAAARAAAEALAAGTSLTEAARENDKALKPVSLGWVEKRDLLPELAEAVFALGKGQTTKPVKTTLGWHIVHVTDAEEGKVQSFEDVRGQLAQELASHEAADAIFAMTNKLEDALAAGATIEEAARQLGLKAHRAEVDARGRDAAGEPADGLPPGQSFLRTAFETQDGLDSALTETQNGGYFILHVNKVTPPKARPLDDVRDAVLAAWKAEARADAAEAQAKALLERIEKGEKIEAVAQAEKLEVKTTPPFTRLTHDSESGLPAALMDRMFALKPGEAAMAEGAGGYTVAVLTEIQPAADKEKAETAEALTEELRQGLAGDLFQQFVGALRARYDVEIKPGLLQRDNQ